MILLSTALAAAPQATALAWDQVVTDHTPSGMCVFVLRFDERRLVQVSVTACHQDHLNRALALIEQASLEAPAGEHVLTVSFRAPESPRLEFTELITPEQARAGDYRVAFDRQWRTELWAPDRDERLPLFAPGSPSHVDDWSAPELLAAAKPPLHAAECSVLVGLTERGTVSSVEAWDCANALELEHYQAALRDAIFQPLLVQGEPRSSQAVLDWHPQDGWEVMAPWDRSEADYQQVRVKHPPRPDYPDAMRSGGHQGVCKVRFLIDTHGTPTHVVLEDCPLEFAGTVVTAGMDARFDPARLDGEPIESEFLMRFEFKLR